jgi:CubicO group peptidase (beta-lactamase class C family)
LKKILLICIVTVAIPAGVLSLAGVPPLKLADSLETGTGMSAKLACSARHLSGMNDARIQEDLASYGPALRAVSVAYDDRRREARASLLGFSATARYRPGLGCSLEIGDTSSLDDLAVPSFAPAQGPWPRGDRVDTFRDDLQSLTTSMLADDNAAGLETRALLLVVDGAIAGEAYAPGFGPDTPLLGWSMGKSLTSVLLGHLAMTGRLDPEESGLFPAWSGDERRSIRVEDLLQMTSGLDFDETYAPGSDATHMLFAAHSASDVALESPTAFPPGAHFAYSSGTTNLLMRLFTERLGGPQAALDTLHRDVLRPLGMHGTIVEPDPSGVFVGSSYVYATARDWARLGQLMLDGGTLNGRRILGRDWVRRAREPNGSDNEPRYGYQFWLNGGGESHRWPGLPDDAFAMLGNRQQVVMMIPSRNAVIVRLGWSDGGYPVSDHFAALVGAI